MLNRAHANHYAVGHFNINNLEWAKSLLTVAQATNTPIILGVSEGAIKYIGGMKTVVGIVNGLLDDMDITVQVALHLDHGQSLASAKQAIDEGFSSVMFDGSHLSFNENLSKTKELMVYAQEHNVSVEAEIGSIGGTEDGVTADGELGNPDQAKTMRETGINALAAGFGNIHGPYPGDWKGLSFPTLQAIHDAVDLPLVLHGGSGIPIEQVQNAITRGVSKVNVNTECQLAFAKALRGYFEAKQDLQGKGYDPRKILAPGTKAIAETFTELTKIFGCYGRSI